MTYTCPRCGRTSHHPEDFKAGYCGACHDWTRADVGQPDWRDHLDVDTVAKVEHELLFAMKRYDVSPIRLSTPIWNHERALYSAGSSLMHVIDVVPMIFNHRVVLTPKAEFDQGTGALRPLAGYDQGWCYPSFEAALDALAAWDWSLDGTEPPGYLKRVLG